MKRVELLVIVCGLLLAGLAGILQESETKSKSPNGAGEVMDNLMPLGNFSISLTVKDINKSKEFYEKLDFKPVGGNLEQNWLVMQNGPTTVGLFQGMFEKNIMTFNPGWNKDKQTLAEFEDVRAIQGKLKERGLKLTTEADESSKGPASFVLADPDGNVIMFDQHVDKPNQ